ncbi:unnamed protein product [Caenorhabditis angaria]|uniref:Uncharacterized protein n=1 Tax=Caenorhabditis angaria TaxID=860376 RepID=A0A9P1J7P4_9PELO|nr:unnamed protein product [Caenorhabditis angaria]
MQSKPQEVDKYSRATDVVPIWKSKRDGSKPEKFNEWKIFYFDKILAAWRLALCMYAVIAYDRNRGLK